MLQYNAIYKQYNAALTVTGATECTSHRKLYKELGLDSLKSRHLCVLHKIISNGLPACLCNLIPKKSHQYITRNVNYIATYQCRMDAFKSSFFHWTIIEWNKTDIKICNTLYTVFKNYAIRPKINPLLQYL